MENEETLKNLGSKYTCSGQLGGTAYIDTKNAQIVLSRDVANEVGYVYWPINPGNSFVFSFEFQTYTTSNYWGVSNYPNAFGANMFLTNLQDRRMQSSYMLVFDQAGQTGQFATPSAYPFEYVNRQPENGKWWEVTVEVSPRQAVITVNGAVVVKTGAPPSPTTNNFTYVCIWAETGVFPTRQSVRNISMWARNYTFPGRDARSLSFGEIDCENYTLVSRATTQPPGAVCFGSSEIGNGVEYPGFCFTKRFGLCPCRILAWGSSESPYAIFSAANIWGLATVPHIFYIVPKPGYHAVRRRSIGSAPPRLPCLARL
ncbi:hypothetical protein GHT06_003856 [Daphnia sinensis]|uniref:Uncharacterized protein n=1 Tax=Daphnia sinensis TaxID=1820382 RepID=A0AAD5KSZ2_9CRUS|nr:hypothetical protein GHT06_003856 [Daphnia sinensis]